MLQYDSVIEGVPNFLSFLDIHTIVYTVGTLNVSTVCSIVTALWGALYLAHSPISILYTLHI